MHFDESTDLVSRDPRDLVLYACGIDSRGFATRTGSYHHVLRLGPHQGLVRVWRWRSITENDPRCVSRGVTQRAKQL